MRYSAPLRFVLAALLLASSLLCKADHGTFTYTGGTFRTGVAAGQTISVQNAVLSASGTTMSFSCPITQFGSGGTQWNWTCVGGSITILGTAQSLVFKGTFDSGSMIFSGSGGGRGGHTSYAYAFYASFSGTVTSGGVTQAANGSVNQVVDTTALLGTGSAAVTGGDVGWNSAYSPLLVGDNVNGRIVAADGITGANVAFYGSLGSGTGQFTTIAGIAQDASHRIYVTDSALNRVIRMDDITGKNWVQIGSYGTGVNHFNAPKGIVIDSLGKIWVVDSGNNRIVRMDAMSGTNWVSFGSAGSGIHQFIGPSGMALDAQKRIYVADTGNNRLVRFDDLTGKNWVALTEVLGTTYGYLLNGVNSVAVDGAGRIFVGFGSTTGFLLRVNDMTGASLSISSWSKPLTSISLDQAGTVYVTGQFSPGLAEVEDAAATGYFASGLGGAVQQPNVVCASGSQTPTPAAPALSTSALTYGSQNVGEKSAAQAVTLTNFGSATLAIQSITSNSDYPLSNGCTTTLKGGASCTLNIVFDPVATGTRTASLAVSSNGVHPLLEASLQGLGTAPKAVILPTSLSFDAQQLGTTSSAQQVTLSNTGSGPLTLASLLAAGDFTQTSNCGSTVAPGNGCVIQLAFKPTAIGIRSGTLTVADDANPTGTKQVIALSGVGNSSAPSFTLSPEGVQFADEQIGTMSAPQIVMLKNNLAKAVTLSAPSIPAGFKVSTTCGGSLAGGGSCTFNAAFAPASVGALAGQVVIPIAGQTTQAFQLSGTGTAAGKGAVLTANPASVNFGQVVQGDGSALSFMLTNPSGLPVAIHSYGFSGPPEMTVTNYTCPATLAGGASCMVEITYQPTSTSPFNASGTFTFTEGTGAVTQVPVTGQAVVNGGM